MLFLINIEKQFKYIFFLFIFSICFSFSCSSIKKKEQAKQIKAVLEVKDEFYQNFRNYNLTGGAFSFDWEQPKYYHLNEKDYFVFEILKTSRFPQDSMTIKNDPVFKLVAERTPNSEDWLMTTYKLMPSVKFLRKGIDLKDQKFNETGFLGFREIYDLKGNLLDKSYLDGNSIVIKK